MKKRVGDICYLDEIKVGQKIKVISIDINDKAIKRHLLDMGLTKGVEAKIKKMAPAGDPIDIELRGYELCISKSELQKILVEVIK